MARKNILSRAQLNELDELAKEYYSNKEEEKALKKELSEQNTEIKRLLQENPALKTSDGDYIYNAGTLVVKLANRCTKTLNEDKLLEVAKKHKLKSIIKTKEYVDIEALEDLMYKGQIEPEVKQALLECEEVKNSPTLTVKPMTKKKED